MQKLNQLGPVRVDHHMQTVRAVSNSPESPSSVLLTPSCGAGERRAEHVSLQDAVRDRGHERGVDAEPPVGVVPDGTARSAQVGDGPCGTGDARDTVSHGRRDTGATQSVREHAERRRKYRRPNHGQARGRVSDDDGKSALFERGHHTGSMLRIRLVGSIPCSPADRDESVKVQAR